MNSCIPLSVRAYWKKKLFTMDGEYLGKVVASIRADEGTDLLVTRRRWFRPATVRVAAHAVDHVGLRLVVERSALSYTGSKGQAA